MNETELFAKTFWASFIKQIIVQLKRSRMYDDITIKYDCYKRKINEMVYSQLTLIFKEFFSLEKTLAL